VPGEPFPDHSKPVCKNVAFGGKEVFVFDPGAPACVPAANSGPEVHEPGEALRREVAPPAEERGTGWPQFFLKPEKKEKKDMGEKKKKKDSKDMKRIDYSKWDKFADMASNTDSEEERERLAGGTTNYSKSLRDFLEKEGAKDWDQVSAERLKSEGNGLVQSKKYEDALGKYTKALEHLCGRTGGEISTLQVALHNNAALCHLKAGNFTAALTACESARRIDPKNFKALLRHGQASAGLGAFLDAYCDFREAAELEPGDRAVAAELARVRKQLKEQGLEDEELEEVLKGYCGWWEEGERL